MQRDCVLFTAGSVISGVLTGIAIGSGSILYPLAGALSGLLMGLGSCKEK
jgi:hypothetical protein